MTDLNSLMIFAKVVEANSFSEAARRLKMLTSTVSRRVADLEDELGVRLLERSTRKIRLTDVGRPFSSMPNIPLSLAKRWIASLRTICRTCPARCGSLRHPAFLTRGSQDTHLPASAGSQPGLSGEVQTAQNTAGSARPSSAGFLVLAAGEYLDLCA